MDYVGKWKVVAMMADCGDKFDFKPIEEILKDGDEEQKQMAGMVLFLKEDGKVYTGIPIPEEFKSKTKEELIQMMKDDGVENPMIEDGYFFDEKVLSWEMRGDDMYMDTGTSGCTYDDDGNEVPCDSWTKAGNPDGTIDFLFAKFAKA